MQRIFLFIFFLLLFLTGYCDVKIASVQSVTCPLEAGYTEYSKTPLLTYNSAYLSYGGGPYYRVMLRYREVGRNWVYKYMIPNTTSGYGSVWLTDLQPATQYEWQVASLCSTTDTVTSLYAAVQTFTVLPCLNSITDLTTSSVSSDKAVAQWSSNISTGGSLTFVVQYRSVNESNWRQTAPHTSRVYTFSGLTTNTVYEWRVAEVCSASTLSNFTDVASFTTNCPQPSGLHLASTLGMNGAKLNWDGLPDVSYELQYKRVTGPPESWTTISGITENTYSLFAANDAYEWRVRTECETGVYSDFSEPASFTMDCSPPSTFWSLNQVTGYSINTNYLFNRDGAEGYIVQWRPEGQINWNEEPITNSSYYVLTGLQNNTGYEIRLQNQCSSVRRSEFTTPVSITASCPTAYWPAFVQNYGYLQWGSSASPVLVGYVLEWRKESAVDWQSSPVLNELQPGSVGYQLTKLETGTYKYRIKTLCADGSSSAYTPIGEFNYQSCSDQPTIQSMYVLCTEAQEALIQFTACRDQQNVFEVRWRKKGDDCWDTAIVPDSILHEINPVLGNLATRSYRIRLLQPGSEYEWQILIKRDSETDSIFYTDVQSFTTRTGVPDDLFLDCITNGNATVIWSSKGRQQATDSFCWPSRNHYQLAYRKQGTSDWSAPISVSTNYYYMFSGLSSNTPYEWRARQQFADSTFSEYSSIASFTTTGCLSPTLYSGNFGRFPDCNNPIVSWLGCGNALTTYELRYRPVGQRNWNEPVIVQNQNKNEYIIHSIRNLPHGIPYEAQIRVFCAEGVLSDFGNSVTVIAGCPEGYPCRTPSDICHYDITAHSVVLNWRGPGPFEFRWRKGGTRAWTTVSVPATTSVVVTVYRLDNLEPNTAYDWQVRSVCSTETGFSTIDFFRTACSPPARGRAVAITSTSARLTWTETDPSLTYTVFWRKVNEITWNIASKLITPNYSLSGLTSNTSYEWKVVTDCGIVSPATVGAIYPLRTLAKDVSQGRLITTVKDGFWTDPAVWACHRIPSILDIVQINHRVTVPGGAIGKAYSLMYGNTGSIIIQDKGKLKLKE